MFIVRNAKNKDGLRAEDWIKNSIGQIDSYGNPFEVIDLVWVNTPVHRNAEHTGTKGFEDTEIRTTGGRIEVIHCRKGNGKALWTRPMGTYGPFMARLAKTPFNVTKLAKTYRDGLWKIRDPRIDAEIKALSDKMWESMDEKTKDYNVERIKRMHRRKNEDDISLSIDRTSSVSIKELEEEKKLLFLQQKELEDKRIALEKREKEINDKNTKEIKEGKVAIVGYSEEYLKTLSNFELKRIARTEFNIAIKPDDKSADLINNILYKQNKK